MDRIAAEDREAILLCHKGRGRQVLERLVDGGGKLRRTALREGLDPLSESHLSHLLRDLETAGVIVRRRPGKTKEVLIELTAAGRRLVAAPPVPGWARYLLERLESLPAAVDPAVLRRQLLARGAPGERFAERLAAAVARCAAPPRRRTPRRRARLPRPPQEGAAAEAVEERSPEWAPWL